MAAKYTTIREELHRRLTDGEYPVGHRLPTEQQLAAEFDVNRHTIRRAFETLAMEGVIRRRPRHGTVVVRNCADNGGSSTATRLAYVFVAGHGVAGERKRRATQELLRRFHERHPEIEVVPAPTEDSGIFFGPLPPVFARSAMPTVFRLTYAADYSSQGVLMPFDRFEDFDAVTGELDRRLIAATPDAAGIRRVHAVPVQAGVRMFIVNRTLLRRLGLEMPSTLDWEALETLCLEIGARGSAAGVHAFSLELHERSQFMTRFFPYFTCANGGVLPVDAESGRACMTAPGNELFLAMLQRLYRRRAIRADEEGGGFREGRAVFRLSGNQGVPAETRDHLGGAEIEARPIPSVDGGEAATVLRGQFMAALAATLRTERDARAAWEFVKFMVSREAQELVLREEGELPVRPDLADAVEAGPWEEKEFFRYGMRRGEATFDVPRNLDIHGAIQRGVERGMKGRAAPEAALAEAQIEIESFLAAARRGERIRDYSMVV